MVRLSLAGALLAPGCQQRSPQLPADVAGTLVFVSDRTGIDALYLRRLPDGPDLRLTYLGEPAADPALSPDAQHVAFAVGGRIAVLSLATRDTRYLSLGVSAHDAEPAWHPGGRRLAIASRRASGEQADLFELTLAADGAASGRRRLTETPADERQPVYGPRGESLVFVREDNLHRLDLADSSTRKLTAGLRRVQKPSFLPSGRLLFLWSEAKQFGIDVSDADGRNRQTLARGSTCYSTVAASPDGRYLVATDAFDLGFRPAQALTRRRNRELRLLDARGVVLAPLTRSWRDSSHSGVWGR